MNAGALRLALACLAAGCANPPVPAPPAAPAPVAAAPAAAASTPPTGVVLGRSDRLLVYRSAPGDTLRSLAARFLGSEERDWVIGEFNALARLDAGQTLVVPLAPPNPPGVTADRYQTVPILCYHRFGNGGGKMTLTPQKFAAQLEWLAANGYRVVRLGQLVGWLAGREALPQRAVVITIDDGYESVYRHAWPLLRRHGFPATLFVYTDFIGTGEALSWAQLGEMADSGVVEVQAHSKSHRNLIERAAGETDARYRALLDAETRTPRELLERKLQRPVRHYAYPFGDSNEQLLQALVQQRYELATTVHPGGNAFFAEPLMLRRTMIFGDYDLEAFKARLQTSRPLAGP